MTFTFANYFAMLEFAFIVGAIFHDQFSIAMLFSIQPFALVSKVLVVECVNSKSFFLLFKSKLFVILMLFNLIWELKERIKVDPKSLFSKRIKSLIFNSTLLKLNKPWVFRLLKRKFLKTLRFLNIKKLSFLPSPSRNTPVFSESSINLRRIWLSP